MSERIGGYALDDGGDEDDADDLWKQGEVLAVHNLIDQGLGRPGQNEAASAIDDHQEETTAQEKATRLDELPDLGKNFLQIGFGAGGGELR